LLRDPEIDNVARHMLTEMVVRQVQPGSDEWLHLLTRRCPAATLTDREYIAMRVKEMVAQWQGRTMVQD
jgi:hypothetical protein